MAMRARSKLFVLTCISAGFVLYCLFSGAEFAQAAEPLEIVNISPSGEDVPAGRSIVFQFNRQVVPVGSMGRKSSEIPISIAPGVKGQWRWMNTTTLAYNLDEDSPLKPATRYDITVSPGIKTEDGATLGSPVRHSFITERPAVVHSWFRTWRSPSMPVIRVTFNQPVSRGSVEKSLFIEILSDRENPVLINAEPDEYDRSTPIFLPLPGEEITLVNTQKEQEKGKKSTVQKIYANEARRVWLVYPDRELPEDSLVSLRVKPGLESALGTQKGVENRELTQFRTFPEFSFRGMECFDKDDNRIFLYPGRKIDDTCLCNPMNTVLLAFSSPVLNSEIKEKTGFDPSISNEKTEHDPWANMEDYTQLNNAYKSEGRYHIYLPRVFKPNQVYSVTIEPGLQDEFGRVLKEPVNISFAMDHMPPDFDLTNQISMLEKDEDTDMPMVVTNLDKITLTYDRLTSKGRERIHDRELPFPKATDVTLRTPMGVRDMLEGQSGVVQGTVATKPYVKKWGDEYQYFAGVTPFQVHVKAGHFNTMAWVTDLRTGKPVRGAKVGIYKDTQDFLSESPEILTQGQTGSDGTVMLAGSEELDPENKYTFVYDRNQPLLFVKVEKGDDMALMPMNYDFLVNTSQASRHTVYSYRRSMYGHIQTWGATAQGVYRAGDNIQFKIYVRNRDNDSLVPAPKEKYSLKVIDPMGKIVHEAVNIELSDFGAIDGEFIVPVNGAVGWYYFYLASSFTDSEWQPMRVLVSDFTPSPFKVATSINGSIFCPEERMEITTQAMLHGGGPYTDASARISVMLKEKSFVSDDPSLRGFVFDSHSPGREPERMLFQKESVTDQTGSLISSLNLPESDIYYGRIEAESAVRDDRGKYITSRASAAYSSRDRFTGLRTDSWMFRENELSTVDVVVVDSRGVPVKDSTVSIKVEHRETTAARVKGAGNAYLTKLNTEWVEDESHNISSQTGPFAFTFTPKKTGYYRITASVKDSKERKHTTQISRWVTGSGVVLWDDDQKNGLDIIPEKTEYRVGEKARYMVQNPFPGAKALVTVERYGVIKHWVQTLETATPVIELKIEEDFIPGFYLSVVVMSPRIEKAPLKDNVDLGKPAFRMGYVQSIVSDPFKQLTVDVKTDKAVCKPGDRIRVDLSASHRGRRIKEPVEFAVAVLDEAVLDLLSGGKENYDPYKGFYRIDTLDMMNYSLLMQLVGRQKFDKKGADPAGDGGKDLGLRDVFKFLSYWNPSIRADSRGRADFEFEVPDNLTGWRVLAMAVTPEDKMGPGEGRFSVNRPTEIRPVMPNQVTEGDSFQAGFSVMNRTDNERELDISIRAEGAIETEDESAGRETAEKVRVEPYKRVTVWLSLKAGREGKIRFTARAGDSTDRDGTVYELDVLKMTSLETSATYGSLEVDSAFESISYPEDIRTDSGSVFVNLSPTVIGNVEGAFEYLRDYPYSCWEQKLSKAVMASHFTNLEKYVSDGFTWDGAKEVPEIILKEASAYQASGGGMAYYIPEDRYVSPYLSAYTAIAFNWLEAAGYEIPATVKERLHGYLADMLRKDVMPDFYTKGMASTVRAVALAALAESGEISVNDLRRYYPHVKEMDVFGMAHFLLAASLTEGAEDMREDVFNMILSRSDQTAGKFIVSETFDDGYERILTSPLRTNAAVLSAFIAYSRTKEGETPVGDIPFRMVRYITQSRKQGGRWENTQENVFCMNSLVQYSEAFEKESPNMAVTAAIGEDFLGEAKFRDFTNEPVTLTRPIEGKDPGTHTQATIKREGSGRLYYSVGMTYAPKELPRDTINAGIDIKREYSVERDGKWILLEGPMGIKRGELVRVDLYVSIPAGRNFVVVNDSVPGGLEPVNRDLATASTVDADKADSDYAADSWFFHYGDWSYYGMSRWSFYHKELRHHAVRFYSEYLMPGNYHLSYTAQAIAPGEFTVMPAHAEEMYDPDVFGKSAGAMLSVEMGE